MKNVPALGSYFSFICMYSLNRLADLITFSKWQKESEHLRESTLVQQSNDFNESGAVMIWTDYDHVVPDWELIMKLGFSGIIKRAREYCGLHNQNGTLDATIQVQNMRH